MRWTPVVLIAGSAVRGDPCSKPAMATHLRRTAQVVSSRRIALRLGRVVDLVSSYRGARMAAQPCNGEPKPMARSPGVARSKPLTPSRAGMPGDPATVVTTLVCLLPHHAHGASDAEGIRHSRAPSHSRESETADHFTARALLRRGNALRRV